MYKIKRFSIRDKAIGTAAGALGGFMLSGKLKAGPKATGALTLGGAALGLGASLLGSRLGKKSTTYTPTPSSDSKEINDILNSIVLPNLPKEYDSLKRWAEGAKNVKRKYRELPDDWQLDVIFYEPENIAEYYPDRFPGEDYLTVLEFGYHDDLTFYYNIKDKNWYYTTNDGIRMTKVHSFKKTILDLYEGELKLMTKESGLRDNEAFDFSDYLEYLRQMIKYTKGSNLK